MERTEGRSNHIFKGVIYFICTLCIVYFISYINVTSAFAQTVDGKEISSNEYTLTLEERGGIKETIKGSDIKLNYNLETAQKISFDENLLNGCINKLSCLDNSKTLESQSARLVYVNNSYTISKEVYGNKVNRSVLHDTIVKAIQNKETTINLDAKKCYEDPKFITSSPEIIKAKDTLNKYLSANITYNIAGVIWKVDYNHIKDWVSVDGNLQVTLNEGQVRAYVDSLANKYTTSLGTAISVCGGYDGNNHSWVVDSSQETVALINNIKGGQTITKSPIYAQTSGASYFSNVGTTFVEVDMTKQHLWFYKGGYLVVDGDIVTGNLSIDGCATPTGVYNIYSMQKDAVLTGQDYASPVSFWMPFTGNYGLHDAPWRSEFGGEIYKTGGSHGCVNLPYSVAQAIYNNAYVGVPVILYYS